MGKYGVKPAIPVINRAHPLAKGLVGCWPFFERGGTILRDISGKNNHGTLTDMDPAIDWVKTPSGYGLDFDGVNDRVVSSKNINITGASPRTVEFRVKKVRTGVIEFCVTFGYGSGSGQTGYAFSLGSSATNWEYEGNYQLWNTGIATAPYVDIWSHHVVTYNGTNFVWYIDGQIRATSGVITINTSNTVVEFGKVFYNGSYFQGIIDNVRIWNRVLSPKEITQLYANPNCIYKYFNNDF